MVCSCLMTDVENCCILSRRAEISFLYPSELDCRILYLSAEKSNCEASLAFCTLSSDVSFLNFSTCLSNNLNNKGNKFYSVTVCLCALSNANVFD